MRLAAVIDDGRQFFQRGPISVALGAEERTYVFHSWFALLCRAVLWMAEITRYIPLNLHDPLSERSAPPKAEAEFVNHGLPGKERLRNERGSYCSCDAA